MQITAELELNLLAKSVVFMDDITGLLAAFTGDQIHYVLKEVLHEARKSRLISNPEEYEISSLHPFRMERLRSPGPPMYIRELAKKKCPNMVMQISPVAGTVTVQCGQLRNLF